MTTILDSFEDGDISEYSGDTSAFSVTANDPYDGSQTLDPDITQAAIYRNDVTISPGETPFGAWIRAGGALDSNGLSRDWEMGMLWAVPNAEFSGYGVAVDGSKGEVLLQRYDQGSEILLSSVTPTNPSITQGTYYDVKITQWTSNGDIEVVVTNDAGTDVATVTNTDTTYGSGGVGWFTDSFGSSIDTQPLGDYYTKPIILSSPSNVQITDDTNEGELTLDWDEASNATSYNVYRAQSSGSSTSDYTLVAEPSGPPYTDTGLEDGEQYYYRVSSEN
jgi:hypothetical protein